MLEISDKDFKAHIMIMVKGQRETMFNEVKEGLPTMSHQVENIRKEKELILKKKKEPNGNSGVGKFNN